jgi:glutathione S-transferase
MLELYHHGSSVCAAKVRMVFAEKKIEWAGHYLDLLRGEQFNPEFLRINPKAMVPVLVHDGKIIIESTVICEYVEEVFPDRPVYPEDPHARAQVRIWTKAVDEDLHPACSAITYTASHRHQVLQHVKGFDDFLKTPSTESVETRRLKWQWIERGFAAPGLPEKIALYDRYLRKMEKTLEAGPWLVGDRFSMADIALTPYVNRLAMLGMDGMWRGRLPKLEKWFERIQARPSFKPALIDWIPDGLKSDLITNGRKSWPEVQRILGAA